MFEQSVDSILSIWASMSSWFTSTVLFVLLNVMIGTIAITSSRGTQKHSNRQQEAQEHPQQPQLARSPSILQRFKSINFYSYRSQETTTAFEQTTESYTHYASNQHLETEQPQLSRSPSMLQRLKSISLSNYRFQEQPNPSISLEESDTHYSNFQQPRETEDEEEEEEEGGGGGGGEEEEEEGGEEGGGGGGEEEEEGEGGGEEEEEELAQASDQDEEVDQYDKRTLDEIYGKLQGAQVNRTRSETKPASGEVPVKLSRKMKKSASAKSAFAHFEEEDIVEIRRPETVRERKVGVTEDDDDEVNARADDFINRFKQQLKLQRLDSIIRYKDENTGASGK